MNIKLGYRLKISYVSFVMLGCLFDNLIRANADDGELDITFGNQGIVTSNFNSFENTAHSLSINQANRICVLGTTHEQSVAALSIACYEPNGVLDTTFNAHGRVPGLFLATAGVDGAEGFGIAMDDQEKIIGVGAAHINATTHFFALRLTPQGTLDPSFNKNGIVLTPLGSHDEVAYKVAVKNNKTYVAGMSDGNLALVCYNSDGSLDASFAKQGTLIYRFTLPSSDQMPKNLSPTRNRLLAWATPKIIAVYRMSGLVVQADGKLLVAGTFTEPQKFFIARYLPDGQLDSSFHPLGPQPGILIDSFASSHDSARSLALQGENIMVAGSTIENGKPALVIARYLGNGTRDRSFNALGKNPGMVVTALPEGPAQVEAIVVQPDEKILAAAMVFLGQDIISVIARYTATGELDSSFNPHGAIPGVMLLNKEGHFSRVPTDIALQSDGKIIIGGYAKRLADTDFILMRLTNDNDLIWCSDDTCGQAFV